MRKTIVHHIHKMRQKSEETRTHILHVATFCGAVVLILIWIVTLKNGFDPKETKEKLVEDLKPFSQFRDNVANTDSPYTIISPNDSTKNGN